MAAPQIKSDVKPLGAAPDQRPHLSEANDASRPTPSPVHALHLMLEGSYLPEPVVRGWPPVAKLACLAAGLAASWTIVLGGAWLVAR